MIKFRTLPAMLAVVVAAAVAGMQAWGWGDTTQAMAVAASYLGQTIWPVLRVPGLSLAAAALVYVLTDKAAREEARRRWPKVLRPPPGQVMRRLWFGRLCLLLAGAGIVALLSVVVLAAPGRLVAHETMINQLTPEQRAEAVRDTRTDLMQAIGGSGAIATWQQVVIARKGQVTERFTRAVDQLGDDEHPDVRIGGLYALERIAHDSKDDRRTIAEILTAYVRQRAPWPPTKKGSCD
jgi:hypothetical protein